MSFLRKAWLPAGFALIIGLTLRIYFAVAVPIAGESKPGELSSYNDEIAHAGYTDFLLKHHALPAQVEPIDAPGALQRGSFENYQPPLYYLLHSLTAALWMERDFKSIVLTGRFISILFGILLIPVFLLIARELQLSSAAIAAGLVFLSISGILIRFQAACTNDSLFWLLIGISYWIALRLQHSERHFRYWMLFTAVVSLALYTKLSALLLIPLPLLIVLRRKSSAKLLHWGIALGCIILLTLPVWIRNLNDFGGLLPLHAGFGSPAWRMPALSSMLFSFRSLIFPWSEFWQGIIGIILISIPFIIILFFRYRNSPGQRIGFDIFSFGFVLTFIAFLWLNLQYDQAESRYLFAAWPAFALFVSRSARSVSDLWLLNGALLLPFLLFLL